MNREFLSRSYKTALITLAIVLVFAVAYRGPKVALGFGLAALLGIANVRFIESIAVAWVREGGPQPGRVLTAVALKLIVVYGGGLALLMSGLASPMVIAAGFTMIFVVILLKSLGLMLLQRSGTLRGDAPPK